MPGQSVTVGSLMDMPVHPVRNGALADEIRPVFVRGNNPLKKFCYGLSAIINSCQAMEQTPSTCKLEVPSRSLGSDRDEHSSE